MPIVGALQGYGALHSIGQGAALPLMAGLAYRLRHRRRAAATLVSLGLITSSAPLVHLSGGVVEMHFHFFVMIVVLALYEDWLPFLIAAAYVVIHHGLMGALAPQEVYNHPDAIAHPLKWAAIHGAFVTAAGIASVVAWRLNEDARSARGAYRQTRQILETAHDAFISIDERGLITDCTPQAESAFGWAREELLGRELAETIIPERYREAHRRGIAHFLASGEGPALGKQLELMALHREGYEFPLELTISALHTEEGYVFNAFLRDISERKRHERYLEAQHATQVVLGEAEKVSDAVPRLLEAIGKAMDWEFGAFWGVQGGKLTCDTTWMASDSHLEPFDEATRRRPLKPGVGLPGRVFQSSQQEFVEDVRVDGNFTRAPAATEVGLSAAVALPLCVRGEVRGVIEFFSRGARYPEPELIEMMETLTALIGRFFGIVTEREELRRKLEGLALTDELTALPNRRAWEQGLKRELARAERTGESLCVALVDLDDFKGYNDAYGHPAGDELLRETAAAWTACMRPTDLLARLGGDEFALAFPAQTLEAALAVVERVRAASPDSMTCSAGLAPWRSGETAHQLISRADTALYEAKRTGRDKTLLAGHLAALPAAPA
ncbi:MAG: sensor domain-containing diguanylate cyclase [Thermoleophilaceae bacterium]